MGRQGQRLLAGDIGGTNARLALFVSDSSGLREERSATFPSEQFPSLSAVIRTFLAADPSPPPSFAGLGIAGPVHQGRCRTTNLSWTVDSAELARDSGIGRVLLLNDLEAMAWALSWLPPESFEVLAAGEPRKEANAALIAAGTGLGEAGLAWDGTRLRPFATEGGHCSFAPNGALERALLEHFSRTLSHVSWERVVSGPGLVRIHAFLVEHRRGSIPPWLAEEMQSGEAPKAISRAALEERDELAGEALDLFVRLYGSAAGNLALTLMARGGLFLGGGIANEILPRLRGETFLETFRAKGRMRPLLESIPVRVLTDDRAALLGAALATIAADGEIL